jgi:hypothetical protein
MISAEPNNNTSDVSRAAIIAVKQLFVFGTHLPRRRSNHKSVDRNGRAHMVGLPITCFDFLSFRHEHPSARAAWSRLPVLKRKATVALAPPVC